MLPLGSRFSYTYYDKSKGEIWESIQDLDHKVTFVDLIDFLMCFIQCASKFYILDLFGMYPGNSIDYYEEFVVKIHVESIFTEPQSSSFLRLEP